MNPKVILEKDFGLAGKLVIIDEGNGYFLRAVRTLIGTALVVVIDWQLPNTQHFSDGMVFVKTPHMKRWKIIQVIAWSVKYDSVKDYPMLKPLFNGDNVSTILEDLFSIAGD